MLLIDIGLTIVAATVIGISVLLFLCWATDVLPEREWSNGNFDQRWPPISEDEFIRRCHPGVNRDIALRVRRVIARQLGVPYDQVYPEQNFVNDLGAD